MVDGGKLKHWRTVRSLSLRELAERSRVNHAAISQIERGRRTPHPSTVRKLAAALGVDPEMLLVGFGGEARGDGDGA